MQASRCTGDPRVARSETSSRAMDIDGATLMCAVAIIAGDGQQMWVIVMMPTAKAVG
jgi:hypothetical protein